jgi:putative ABC transport system substrate-binding protein
MARNTQADSARHHARGGVAERDLGSGDRPIRCIQSGAHALGVELTPVGVRDADEIERGVEAFARSGNGGLIITVSGTGSLRAQIIALASRLRLPAIYPYRYYAIDGGLISYGPDTLDLMRRAAGYVDRILKGDKPSDLPVQAPNKYDLMINLRNSDNAHVRKGFAEC